MLYWYDIVVDDCLTLIYIYLRVLFAPRSGTGPTIVPHAYVVVVDVVILRR